MVLVSHATNSIPGCSSGPTGYGHGSNMDDELKIRASREQNTATVVASGEIDLSTVDELRSAVTGAADDVETLLLDLTDVEFIDSAGLGGLLELRSTLRSRRVTLQISAGDGPVKQAMQITGLSELLADEK